MALVPELTFLQALANAYAEPHPQTNAREPILYLPYVGGSELQHHALVTEGLEWDEEMLTRLDEIGLIRFDYGSGTSRNITVTPAGEALVAQLERAQDDSEPDVDDAVSLDWSDVGLPTLRVAYELWIARGAPDGGIPTALVSRSVSGEDTDPQTLRAVSMLEDGGYVRATSQMTGNDAPLLISITAHGLRMVAGWPTTSGEAATTALLTALDQRIAETDDPQERAQLQRLKDAALEVGRETLTEVLTRIITGEVTAR